MSRVTLHRWHAVAASVVGLLGALPDPCAQTDEGRLPRATVQIRVFGAFGEPVRDAQVHLISRDRKRDLVLRGDPAVIAGVPYGDYVISAWDTGGGIADRELAVNAKEVCAYVGLSFPAGDRAWPAGDFSITGEIQPSLGPGNWWARAEGIFLHASRETRISPAGRFKIDGLEMGAYLVEIFEGSKLRHIESLEIDGKHSENHLRVSALSTQ